MADFFFMLLFFWYYKLPEVKFMISTKYTEGWKGYIFRFLGAIEIDTSSGNVTEHTLHIGIYT
jgi:hypothetical protein